MGVGSHFEEMCDAAMEVIRDRICADADDNLIDALLYVIARDNECETVAGELAKHKDWFDLLSKRSLGSVYVNAQWQLAKRLPSCVGCDKELIFEFIRSDNEYVSRISLMALAELFPEKAEAYAIDFWNRGIYDEGSYEDEYQKIMVLHVLNKVHSPALAGYLDKAAVSGFRYLKENAEQIKEQLSREA